MTKLEMEEDNQCSRYMKERRRVMRFVEKWQTTIGLGMWKLDIVWSVTPLKEDGPESMNDNPVFMLTKTSWEYTCAQVSVYLPGVPDVDDSHLELIIVHELSHVLTNPCICPHKMNDREFRLYQAQEERAVTDIAKALIWSRNQGFREGQAQLKKEAAKRLKAATGKRKSIKKGK